MFVKSILLLTCLVRLQARPQPQNEETPTVEIEQQELFEQPPEVRQLYTNNDNHPQKQPDDQTKAILAKIAEVNAQHGLSKPRPRPMLQFPMSYLRSQPPPPNYRQSTDFKFPTNPYSNPIFDYIEQKKSNKNNIQVTHQMVLPQPYAKTPEVVPVKVEPADVVPGQYIKRKITHQQTFLVPLQVPQGPDYYTGYGAGYPMPVVDQRDQLATQTIENVQNIVRGTEHRPGKQFGQFNWPFGQYFPIHVRDPVMQMVNAVTSMVEYGPGAGTGGFGCKTKPPKPNRRDAPNDDEIDDDVDNEVDEQKVRETSTNPDEIVSTFLEIEDLVIGGNETSFRTSKLLAPSNATIKANQTKAFPFKLPSFGGKPPTTTLRPPIKESDDDFERAEDGIQVTKDGNKELFSKDNTGSGIFIHRLKVRKGGVAIAGPGGIATAGSGGTAIVGPNGFAYTHPDSLAIAGSGTKVIAVEPNVDLAELVNGNRTRGKGQHPRVGKVVAVGPVVYYNKG